MFTSRYAVFVDAGYVFGQGALSVSIGKLTRAQLRLDETEIIKQLRSITSSPTGEMLRIYWYDGTRGNMTLEQNTLAEMSDIKMRLGYINGAGYQKGVDSLIITDLIELARNQAIADAYVVSGDGDLRVAVQIAQSFGVRVHLITLAPSNSSLNPQLRQEVDTKHEIPKVDVAKFLQLAQPQPTLVPIAASSAVASSPGITPQTAPLNSSSGILRVGSKVEEALRQAIKNVLSVAPPEEVVKLKALQSGRGIPSEYDRKILGTSRALLNRDLTDEERTIMRKLAREWIDQVP